MANNWVVLSDDLDDGVSYGEVEVVGIFDSEAGAEAFAEKNSEKYPLYCDSGSQYFSVSRERFAEKYPQKYAEWVAGGEKIEGD